jgi:hypothetical protein
MLKFEQIFGVQREHKVVADVEFDFERTRVQNHSVVAVASFQLHQISLTLNNGQSLIKNKATL